MGERTTLAEYKPDGDVWLSTTNTAGAAVYHVTPDCPHLTNATTRRKDPELPFQDSVLCEWCERNETDRSDCENE